MSWKDISGGGGSVASLVQSVFGRIGEVVAEPDDYSILTELTLLSFAKVSDIILPQFILEQTSAVADEKLWALQAQNGKLSMLPLFDDGNPGEEFLLVDRAAAVTNLVKFGVPRFEVNSGSINFAGDIGSDTYFANGSFGTNSMTGTGDPLENRVAYQMTIGHNSDVLGQRVGIAFGVGVSGLIRTGAGIYSNHREGLNNSAQTLEFYVNDNTGSSFLALELMNKGYLKTFLPETVPLVGDLLDSQGIFWLNNVGMPSYQVKLKNSGSTETNINLSREQILTLDFDDTTVQDAIFPLQAGAFVFIGAAGATNFQLPTRAAYLAAHQAAPLHIIRDDANLLTIMPAGAETIDGAATLPLSLGTKSQVTLVPDTGDITNWRVLNHATIG